MTHLVVREAPGGCKPATLHCECGAAELAIWTAKLGARCSGCDKCYAFRIPLVGVYLGIFQMVRGPDEPGLHDWPGSSPAWSAARTGD